MQRGAWRIYGFKLVRQRIELDFDYVGNWTLWMDVEIVLRTIGQVIFLQNLLTEDTF